MDTKNIFKSVGKVTFMDRCSKLSQFGAVFWFIGRSGAGKSSIAIEVEKLLFESGKMVFRLDGDNMRLGLCRDLQFSKEDRDENIRRIAEVAKLFCDAGVIVLVCTISPFKQMRDCARTILNINNYHEIYVKASYKCCSNRDPKQLYLKAKNGELKNFNNIDFEDVDFPDCILNTEEESIQESVEKAVIYIYQSIGLMPHE